MSVTRVAVCQIAIDIDDPAATRETVEQAVRGAAAQGAVIIVLPELANTGYLFRDSVEGLARSEDLDGPTISRWRALSRELSVIIIGGFCERGPGSTIFNSAVLIEAGTVRCCYRKTHLWDAEKRYFTPGAEPAPVVETSAGQIGVMICYDLEFPEFVRDVALRGAQLVAGPSNWPVLAPWPADDHPIEVVKAQASAAVNQVFVAVADRAGRERGQDWIGGSVIVGVDGYLLGGPDLGRPTMIISDLELGIATDKTITERNHAFGDRRPELYRDIVSD